MSFDLWSHEFCLACDKQVEHDGAAYCSETCRLAELDSSSNPRSQASSPGLTAPSSYPWALTTPTTPTTPTNTRPSRQLSPVNLILTPEYDFGNARPYNSKSPTSTAAVSLFGNYIMGSKTSSAPRTLSPSSSRESLCSMQSASGESTSLSTQTAQELRAYAVSFEHVRNQRRRSY